MGSDVSVRVRVPCLPFVWCLVFKGNRNHIMTGYMEARRTWEDVPLARSPESTERAGYLGSVYYLVKNVQLPQYLSG